MPERRVLVSCRLVWDAEAEIREQLERVGIEMDMPRYSGQQMEEEDLFLIIGRYEGILAGDDHLSRRVLEAAPRLKVISKWGIGVDAIDQDAARELGIEVFNTPGVFGEELADYAMGYIHMLARRQHDVNARVKAGEWYKVRGVSLAGRTLGIVGLGSSGSALAKRAAASSMRVIACDVADVEPMPACQIVELEELLDRADVISLHVPAMPSTRHMINASSIERMRPGCWLVNTSRGALVDEVALVDALRSGAIGAAALDVFEVEPVDPSNPLLELDNVIVGAHNGSNTREAVQRTTEQAVDNLLVGLGVATT